MILEILEHFLTPASKHAKSFGYLHQSIALKKRYQRNKLHWQSHIDQCHQLVTSRLQKLAPDSRILILGSGLLLETPIEFLLKKDFQIFLLDAYHPRDVQKRASGNSRIHLIEEDLNSSMISELLHQPLAAPTDFADFDFVISSNVMSQLPLFPLQWFEKTQTLPESKLQALIFTMFRDHLARLKKAQKGALVFTDIQREYVDKSGKLSRIEPSLLGFELPKVDKEWIWNLAPIPEFSKKESLQLRVQAFDL